MPAHPGQATESRPIPIALGLPRLRRLILDDPDEDKRTSRYKDAPYKDARYKDTSPFLDVQPRPKRVALTSSMHCIYALRPGVAIPSMAVARRRL